MDATERSGDPTGRAPDASARPRRFSILDGIFSESAIYGIILVSALIVVTGRGPDGWQVLLRVAATVVIFWVAHVFANLLASVGRSDDLRPWTALAHGISETSGMLLAALVPLLIILLGALRVVSTNGAVWTALWVNVTLLAVLAYLGVARQGSRVWVRWAMAGGAALLGVLIVVLKAYIH